MQSLRNKVDDLNFFLQEQRYKHDIICISEHWLKVGEIEFFKLYNYFLASYYGRIIHKNGGVAIFIKKELKYKARNDINCLSRELHCELTAIELTRDKIVIITVYRHPPGDINVFLEIIEEAVCKVNLEQLTIVLIGDFNIKFHTNEKTFLQFKNLINEFNLNILINEPTRLKNCLDNIITNHKHYKTVVYDLQIADHKSVSIDLSITERKTKITKVTYRPITQMGQINFFNLIEQTNFDFIKSSSFSLDTKFDIFIEKFQNAYISSFPIRIKQNHNVNCNIEWFSERLKRLRETKILIKELCDRYKTPQLKDLLKEYKIIYAHEITIAKKNAFNAYIANSNNIQRATWNVINQHRIVNNNNKDTNLTAQAFNNFFTNIAKTLVDELDTTNTNPLSFVHINTTETFSFLEVTFNQVRNYIDKIKSKSSSDIYGLNIKIIKNVKNLIINQLTNLINISITSNIFPSALKTSKVIPVFKKGDNNDCQNYRPISLIPIFAKVYEMALKEQICNYFESNELFTLSQFGFRKERSTTAAINSLISHITSGFNDSELTGVICCDLSKAFDCISHETLSLKLRRYGFQNSSIQLINSYLTDRYQTVYLNNQQSESLKISYGVPQGSILGPILFLIYINDINNCTANKLILYADDTSIICNSTNINSLKENMQNASAEVGDWFLANQLTLNQQKTEKIVFTQKNLNEMQNNIKFLGVTLDKKLIWENHVDNMCSSLSKVLYLLRSLKNKVSTEALITAYYGTFHARATYAISTWGHSAHTHKVFGLQRKAIRIITGSGFQEDVRHQFIALKILTLPCVYILQCLLIAKSNLNGYNQRSDFHSYSTRNKSNLQLPLNRIQKSRDANSYFAPKFYNSLPEEFKKIENIIQFKREVKTYLIGKAFYTASEFLTS